MVMPDSAAQRRLNARNAAMLTISGRAARHWYRSPSRWTPSTDFSMAILHAARTDFVWLNPLLLLKSSGRAIILGSPTIAAAAQTASRPTLSSIEFMSASTAQSLTAASASASEPSGRELSLLLANAIRALAMDAVQAANSGHPGMPMGMADIAV